MSGVRLSNVSTSKDMPCELRTFNSSCSSCHHFEQLCSAASLALLPMLMLPGLVRLQLPTMGAHFIQRAWLGLSWQSSPMSGVRLGSPTTCNIFALDRVCERMFYGSANIANRCQGV
jgi:hypothetical protein